MCVGGGGGGGGVWKEKQGREGGSEREEEILFRLPVEASWWRDLRIVHAKLDLSVPKQDMVIPAIDRRE